MPKPQKRSFASCGEVAFALRVHSTTVRNWCRSGSVVCKRTPGGEWRVLVDEQNWPIHTVDD